MASSDQDRRISAADATNEDCECILQVTAQRLREVGRAREASLLAHAELTFERDGGYYYPIPGDNWTSASYEAIPWISKDHSYEFQRTVKNAIWSTMQTVLEQLGCGAVQDQEELTVREQPEPLPEVDPRWRSAGMQERPTNQGRRPRARVATGERAIQRRNLVFDSRAELAVFDMLERIQRELPEHATIAVAPLPGVALRDTVRSPDLLVIGNGRTVVVEVDGPTHRLSRVDDDNRNLGWDRCGVESIRVAVKDLDHDPAQVERLLREQLGRRLRLPYLLPGGQAQ